MIRLFIFSLCVALLASCRAYRIFPKEYRDFSHTEAKRAAFVLNPELANEYSILKEAAIFNLVPDSMAQPVVQIRLLPMQSHLAPANGFFTTLFTAGQLPVLYEDRYLYAFEEIQGGERTLREFELHVAAQVWFWNIFSSKKNFSKQAGQALLASYYAN